MTLLHGCVPRAYARPHRRYGGRGGRVVQRVQGGVVPALLKPVF